LAAVEREATAIDAGVGAAKPAPSSNDVLPPTPQDVLDENLALVARALV